MTVLGGYGNTSNAGTATWTGAGGRDNLGISHVVTTAGSAETFDLRMHAAGTIALKVFRETGPGTVVYDFIGESADIAVSAGENLGLTIAVPFDVEVGDIISVWLTSGSLRLDDDSGGLIYHKTGDATSTISSGLSILNNYALMVTLHGTVPASDTVTITNEPTDLSILQRAADGNADYTLTFDYTGAPTAIEYRLVLAGTSTEVAGHGWQTLDASPSGETGSETITDIPGGGPYNVQLRHSNDTGVTAEGTNAWSVGALFGMFGDSNTRNMFDIGTSYTQQEEGSQYRATTDTWQAASANGARQLIDTLAAGLGVPVGLIHAGVGSTGLTTQSGITNNWQSTNSVHCYPRALNAVNDVGGVLEGIVWNNGGNDAYQGLVTEANYYDGLTALIAKINTDMSAGYTHTNIPFLMVQTGGDGNGGRSDTGYTDVREAQRTFAIDNAQTILAAVSIDLANNNDGHHLAAGYQDIGERVGNAYLDLLGLTAVYPGPTITSWEAISDTVTRITLSHGEGTDFTPTSSIDAFRVLDDATPVTFSARDRVSATEIDLTHTAITGTRTVDYGYGQEPTITNQVKDNSSLALPLVAMKSIPESGSYNAQLTSASFAMTANDLTSGEAFDAALSSASFSMSAQDIDVGADYEVVIGGASFSMLARPLILPGGEVGTDTGLTRAIADGRGVTVPITGGGGV